LIQLAVHERVVVIPILDESRVARSIIVQPRAVDCHGAGLQVVSVNSRPSWDPIDYVLLFPYGTGTARLSPGHPEGRQGEAGHHYGILLLATDTARRPGLNVVLCGDGLFQQ